MRRLYTTLIGLGLAAALISVPLWHVTRWDASGCQIHHPCDPRESLPFGSIALGLTLFGIFAVVVGVVIVLGAFVAHVRALDAEERAADTPVPSVDYFKAL
jgi:Zn-dependent protease